MARKRTLEELGSLITREIMTMLKDESLTKEQRFDILTAVMFDAKPNDTILASYANSLKSGWNKVNSDRIEQIESGRASRRGYMKRVRNNGRVDIHRDTYKQVYARDAINNIDNINNNPLNPPQGIVGRKDETSAPEAISPEELLANHEEMESVRDAAMEIADRVEASEAFGHMRSNRGKLVRSICAVLKKNGGAAKAKATGDRIIGGLEAWTEAWKLDYWQYAPGRVVDWILDEKWLEPVRAHGGASEVGSGQDYGEVGVKEIV